MSLAEDTNLGELSLTKAIIDTGATESVAGIRSMSRLIDSGHFLYDISLDTRPRFRFGNGEHQRAVSKCHVTTNAMGGMDFYLLDGGAEDTPLLIGSRILRARRAMVSYHGDYLAHRGGDGRWWVSQLWSAPGGHLIIDLSQHKLPIEFLLKRFSTNPSTRWPPDEDPRGPSTTQPGVCWPVQLVSLSMPQRSSRRWKMRENNWMKNVENNT